MLTIANTTDTFTAPGGASTGNPFQPQTLYFTSSTAGHMVLVDADNVVQCELYAAALSSKELDGHFFMGIRPWKTPIKLSVLTGGGKVRINV
jgi:hypothetical protein